MNAIVPPPLTWHICHIIVDSFSHVVFVYILNQFKGHWLLSDALNSTIFMSLEFRDEIDFATFDNLMEEDGNVAYGYCVWPPTLKKNEERKVHNCFI